MENETAEVKIGMTEEEGIALVKKFVNFFWVTGRFYSLKRTMTAEDAIQEILLKTYRQKVNGKTGMTHFEKYDPRISTKGYHVMQLVYTTLCSLLQRQHEEMFSLDQPLSEDSDSDTMGDHVPDTKIADPETGFLQEETVRRVYERLPEEDGPVVESSYLGKCVFGCRGVFAHLMLGLKVSEVASVFGVDVADIVAVRRRIRRFATA